MISFLIYILIKKYRNESLKVIYAQLNQFLNIRVRFFLFFSSPHIILVQG